MRWLLNFITGRYGHWNRYNHAYTNALVERAKEFPPSIALLLINCTTGSTLMVDFLVHPNKGSKRIIKLDVKRIDAAQFRAIHHMNIWVLISLFALKNPKFKDSFLAACQDFIGVTAQEDSMIQLILETDPLDLIPICQRLYSEIRTTLNYETDFLAWSLLAPVLLEVFRVVDELYREDIRALASKK